MERPGWEQALARAVTDARFQVRLLANPGEALLDYGLADAELSLLEPLPERATLGQLAAYLLHLAATSWPERASGDPRHHELEDDRLDHSWGQQRKDVLVCKEAPRVQGCSAAPSARADREQVGRQSNLSSSDRSGGRGHLRLLPVGDPLEIAGQVGEEGAW